MRNVSLSYARQGFKFSNQTENKSKKTTTWYDAHLERLETYLQNGHEVQLREITTEQLREFIASLQAVKVCYENHPKRKAQERPLSAYTIRGIVATLSAFFAWCVEEGLLAKSPMAKIQRPKVPRVIKERYSEEDIKKLLAACESYNDTICMRNRAMILFLLDTGVRASELCNLTLDRLDLDHGRAHVTGKGMKDREIYFGRGTRLALWAYIPLRGDSDEARVFLTAKGRPVGIDELGRILKVLGRKAGVAHVHPHRFRHTAARLFLRNGGDAFSLQRLLGHEDLTTTRIYAQIEREDVERACARSSPVDHMNLK